MIARAVTVSWSLVVENSHYCTQQYWCTCNANVNSVFFLRVFWHLFTFYSLYDGSLEWQLFGHEHTFYHIFYSLQTLAIVVVLSLKNYPFFLLLAWYIAPYLTPTTQEGFLGQTHFLSVLCLYILISSGSFPFPFCVCVFCYMTHHTIIIIFSRVWWTCSFKNKLYFLSVSVVRLFSSTSNQLAENRKKLGI